MMRPVGWKAGDLSALVNITEEGRKNLVDLLKDFYWDMTEKNHDDTVVLDHLLKALGAEDN